LANVGHWNVSGWHIGGSCVVATKRPSLMLRGRAAGGYVTILCGVRIVPCPDLQFFVKAGLGLVRTISLIVSAKASAAGPSKTCSRCGTCAAVIDASVKIIIGHGF
jgi:hypothetical protein